MRLNGLNTLRGSNFKKCKLNSSSFVSKSIVMLKSDMNFNSEGLPNMGFIVTKKNGKAVKRNFLKRRIRAAAVSIMAGCAEINKSYIFIARNNLLTCSFSQLEKDMRYCLRVSKTRNNAKSS